MHVLVERSLRCRGIFVKVLATSHFQIRFTQSLEELVLIFYWNFCSDTNGSFTQILMNLHAGSTSYIQMEHFVYGNSWKVQSILMEHLIM